MKIRTDFVTNSSSSSYVTVEADNPVLQKILEKYKDGFGYYFHMDIEDNIMYLRTEQENNYAPEMPDNKEEIILFWIDMFEYCGFHEHGDKIAEEIKTAKQDILDAMGEVRLYIEIWESSDYMDFDDYDEDDDWSKRPTEHNVCEKFAYNPKTGECTKSREESYA